MRLIDADALIAILEEEEKGLETLEFQLATTACINHIKEAPTVEPETLEVDKHIELLGREYVAQDIKNGKGFIVGHFIREPITRCKDCEFYNGLIECETGLLTDPDDFCKFGKKKEANE